MSSKNYLAKILALSAATLAGIFAVWYSLVRPESADWIAAQVAHQVSPYVVIMADDGGLIISNPAAGYEFSLPAGFKTAGARNLSFYLAAGGVKKCLIKHKAEGKNLIFELADEKEEAVCGRYLERIKSGAAVD